MMVNKIVNKTEHRENYYALALAVLRETTPEQAFLLLDGGNIKYTRYSKSNAEDMLRLRKRGLNVQEISDIYNISLHATYRHISRYKKQIYKQDRKRGEIGWDEN